jgi:hypothetical protein
MNSAAGGGLYTAMTYSGFVRADRWKHATATGEVIGTCRECGGYLIPDDVGWTELSPMQWFTASCLDCGHEVAAPGGRVLKHRERGGHGW